MPKWNFPSATQKTLAVALVGRQQDPTREKVAEECHSTQDTAPLPIGAKAFRL